MKMITTFLIVLAVLLGLCAVPVNAQDVPPLPHAFYGTVEINGNPAPARIKVEAIGEGVITGPGNPITTTVEGQYGSADPLETARLVVQGYILEGAIITFYVNDVSTGQTAKWHSGEVTDLDLSVTISAPSGGGGGGGWSAPTYYTDTNLFGTETRFRIDSDGKILSTIEATSADGMLTIRIVARTIALDRNGNRLGSLKMAVDESPPSPPEDAHIIGLAYDFGPDGATFDPPITLTWSYDPDALPEGVAEEDLVIAYYDEDKDKWVELDCVVDTENDTITASVEHFSKFAIIGTITPLPPLPAPAAFSVSSLSVKPAEVKPDESVTIAVSVANTGGTEGSYTVVLKINGVKEEEKRVTVAAGGSQDVSFSVAKADAGTYSVALDGLSGSFHVITPVPIVTPEPTPTPTPTPTPEPTPTPINWPILGGIIAVVALVGLLIFFVVRREAA